MSLNFPQNYMILMAAELPVEWIPIIHWVETLLLDIYNVASFPVGCSDQHIRLNNFWEGPLDHKASILVRVLTHIGKELFKKPIQFLLLSVISDSIFQCTPAMLGITALKF